MSVSVPIQILQSKYTMTTTHDERYFCNWSSSKNACIVGLQGDDTSGVGVDIENFSVLFARANLYILKEEDLENDFDLMLFFEELSLLYKKIVIYFSGHGTNRESSKYPIFQFCSKLYCTFTLHKLLEKLNFVFSVVIVDCCNHYPNKSVGTYLSSLFGMIKSFSDKHLISLLDQRGHCLISSSRTGRPSCRFPDLGGLFSVCYFNYLGKKKKDSYMLLMRHVWFFNNKMD